MNLKASLRALRDRLLPVPIRGAADARWSAISTTYDQNGLLDDGLIELALTAAHRALSFQLSDLERRSSEEEAAWVRTWPGEHYRFLAALADTLHPAHIIEVGTYKGHGALALSAGYPPAQVVTYDLYPWQHFAGAVLTDRVLDPGNIEQRIGDLGNSIYRNSQIETLLSADLLFLDGPKDGHWEQHAVPDILACLTDRRRLVVLDDIRLLPMVQLWRDLAYRKLDVTSLAHWSGTGLVWTA